MRPHVTYEISDSVVDALDRYVKEGIPTGDFLYAVLSNNLMESFGRADDQNRASLFEICSFVYNELPAGCHGSPEKVREWLESFKNKST